MSKTIAVIKIINNNRSSRGPNAEEKGERIRDRGKILALAAVVEEHVLRLRDL